MKLTVMGIKKIVRSWADKLGISDYIYKVSLGVKKNDEDNILSEGSFGVTYVDEPTRQALIELNKSLLNEYPNETERTIVHELLHVRLSELTSQMDGLVEQYVTDRKAKEVYRNNLNLLEHKIVVALTEALLDGKK